MNEEQLIATLQACYFGDRGAFNKILKEYKQLKELNKELISVLKNVRNEVHFAELIDGYLVIDILDKVKEF